jgi:putative transposase/transposase-like zinc-binding protein
LTGASTAARSIHSDQLGILTQTRILAEKGLTQETVDIFRSHGPAWRQVNAGHVSLDQMKVMSAIERCRTAALGGHVLCCQDCSHTQIAYNSCRNRHCPKCQGAAAREWLAEREAELLPVRYFHVVYTLPALIADIAYQNKAVVYDLLFKASAETTLTIAVDPKHLGARIGFLSVLHTWGSALTHHPHVHMIVPGGGLSPDGSKWIACRPTYFLTVEVLSALFRRLFLEMLVAAHDAGRLHFFGDHSRLADKAAFKAYLRPLREIDWVVYAKEPFAGPRQVLRYLSRYTHRIAISNRRLVSADENGVAFKYKDYRLDGPARDKTMTLASDEFIRRFLIHVLPKGFHRIRYYGFLTSQTRAKNIAHIRGLLAVPLVPIDDIKALNAKPEEPKAPEQPCPCCGGHMRIIEIFQRGQQPKHRATPVAPKIRVDTS